MCLARGKGLVRICVVSAVRLMPMIRVYGVGETESSNILKCDEKIILYNACCVVPAERKRVA